MRLTLGTPSMRLTTSRTTKVQELEVPPTKVDSAGLQIKHLSRGIHTSRIPVTPKHHRNPINQESMDNDIKEHGGVVSKGPARPTFVGA